MKGIFIGLALSVFGTLASGEDAATAGAGAILRGLDKINGEVIDLDMLNGAVADFGALRIELIQCRYPEGNPAGDAYAFLTIREQTSERELFSGWMLASSPALNALEHPRYDVWVLRCKI